MVKSAVSRDDGRLEIMNKWLDKITAKRGAENIDRRKDASWNDGVTPAS